MRLFPACALAAVLVCASATALAQDAAAPPPAEAAPPPPRAPAPPAALPPNPPPAASAVAAPTILPPFVEGKASSTTAAGSTGLVVRPGLEVFAEYDLRVTRTAGSSSWFHSFELPRGHGSLSGEYGPARGKLLIEAVRSASEGALVGVSGDSLVMRVREASVGYRGRDWLALDMGILPTLTIPELDGSFNLRAVAATPIEQTGLGSPADLGATARVLFPAGYGFAAAGAYNGEGYTSRELNRGKTVELAAELHPFAGSAAGLPFGIFGSYVLGSMGTGNARADRLTGALLWQGKRIRGGAAVTYAWGVGENGGQRSMLIDGFLRAEPVDRFLLGVRGFYWNRDRALVGDRVGALTGAAGYRIADPLEAFLAVTRTVPESVAEVALPGLNRWDLRVIARVVF